MGNPTSGSKIQITMSLPKNRHRQSRSVASLSLEKLAQQERNNSVEKAAGGTFSPSGGTGEKSVAAFLAEKKPKRRTRSSLGGTEEIVKHLEHNGGALQAEERKLLNFVSFRGHRRSGSGPATPFTSNQSSGAKASTTPGKERHLLGKFGAALFQSPTKLERSMSARLTGRALPEADFTTLSKPQVAWDDVISLRKSYEKPDAKLHDLNKEVEIRPQTAAAISEGEVAQCADNKSDLGGARGDTPCPEHKYASIFSENDPSSLQHLNTGLQTKNGQGHPGDLEKTTVASDNSFQKATAIDTPSAPKPLTSSKDLSSIHVLTTEQVSAGTDPNPDYNVSLSTSSASNNSTQTNGFHLDATLITSDEETRRKASIGENPGIILTPSNLPLNYTSPLLESGATAQPSVAMWNGTLLSPTMIPSALTLHSSTFSSTTVEESTSPTQIAIQPTPCLSHPGSENLCALELRQQPTVNTEKISLILPPAEKLSSLDPFHLGLERFVSLAPRQEPMPLVLHAVHGKSCDLGALFSSKSPDKVTEEELTEAAFLSSLVCEEPASKADNLDDPSQPLLSSSEWGVASDTKLSGNETSLKATMEADSLMDNFSLGVNEDKSNADLESAKRAKLRKRRRSVSASGIGAMLLKVVRVSDSGTVVNRKLPKVGPDSSGMDPQRARDYVILKTSQIDVGQHVEPSPPAAAPSSTSATEDLATEQESRDCPSGLLKPDMGAEQRFDENGSSNSRTEANQPGALDIQIPATCERTDNLLADLSRESVRGEQIEAERLGGNLQAGPIQENGGVLSGASIATQMTEKEDTSTELSEKKLVSIEDTSVVAIKNISASPEIASNQRTVEGHCLMSGEGHESATLHQRQPSLTSHEQEGAALQDDMQNPPSKGANVAVLLMGIGAHNVEDNRGVETNPATRSQVSHDCDTTSEWQSRKPDFTKSINGIGQAQTTNFVSKPAMPLLDENVAVTRENSRSFASMLQVQSLDEYRLAPSSISILANPSFSSSQQDRLWEEQAEQYSSGGRGTPGRDDDTTANVFLHSSSPGGAISSDDQIHPPSGPLRRGLTDSNLRIISGTSGDKGSNDRKKGQGKKRRRPRTPLRSLLAEEMHGKSSGSRSPDGGNHFIHQLMLRFRGSSSKASSPKSPETRPKRRHTVWSSCICFSNVK